MRRLLSIILVAIGCVLGTTPARSQDNPHLPSAAEIDRATSQLQGIYEEKSRRAKTPGERAELAQDIFSKKAATTSAAEQYALLNVAFNLASRGDDAGLLLRIADDLSESFGVDNARILADRLGDITGPVSAASWPSTAARITELIHAQTNQGEFETAEDFVTALASLAKRAKDSKTAASCGGLRKSIVEKKKAAERFSALKDVATKADADPKDVLEFGRLLCFSRADWNAGLPYLRRSGDADLAAMATAELGAANLGAKIAVADRWGEYAAKAPPADRTPIREHALAIYNAALPELDGLDKLKVEEAVDKLLQAVSASGKDPNAWLVLFRSSKPDVWNTKSTDDQKNYAVPLETAPPNVKYLRMRRANGATVILPIDRQGLAGETAGPLFGWNGTNIAFAGARQLGIADRRKDVDRQTGMVGVSRKDGWFSGWGFGHRIHHGGEAQVCWNSEWLPPEVIEISVVGRPLTAEEQRFVLQ
jgi:hypothetical protein